MPMNRAEEIFQLRTEMMTSGEDGDNPIPRKKTFDILSSIIRPTVNAILVKGEPGAGKTTFALELLRAYGKGVYVSTRVSEDQLSDQHPYFKELIDRGEVVDIRSDQQLQVKNVIKFEDLRLASAQDIVEIILQNVTKVWKPLILLDSWDAIAKELDTVERLKVEKSILLIVVQNKAKILFVSEEPNLTTTDYLVDAVVNLRSATFDERRVRRIEINKLRGTAITQPSFLYSLDKARFTLFPSPSIKTQDDYDPKPFKGIQHHETKYSTGSEDLDKFLGGGIAPGSIIVLELGRFVGSFWQSSLVLSICNNFLANGGCVASLPSGGVSPSIVDRTLKAHISNHILDSSLRIASFSETYEPHTFALDTSSVIRSFEIYFKEAMKMKRTRVAKYDMPETGRPCFYPMGMDAAESFFSSEDIIKLSLLGIQSIRQFNDVAMMIVRAGTRSKQVLSDRADLHLKLEEVERSLVLYSVKPPSDLYNVQYDYRGGFPKVKLTPLV